MQLYLLLNRLLTFLLFLLVEENYELIINISLKQENIKDLIKYIITEPEEDEHDKGHRFPFLSCEVLSRENLVLVDKIFENKHAKKEKAKEPIYTVDDSNLKNEYQLRNVFTKEESN